MHRVDYFRLVLADPPVDDLFEPGHGIESPFAILAFPQWEGKWPDLIAEQQNSLVAVLFDAEEFGGAVANRFEIFLDVLGLGECHGIKSQKLRGAVEIIGGKLCLEGGDRRRR